MILWRWLCAVWASMNWTPTVPEPVVRPIHGLTACTVITHETPPGWWRQVDR